jgi:GDP-L-fucose synthase
MKILVTGGTGLIGKALLEVSKSDNNTWQFLSSKDCNLLDYDSLDKLLKKITPDYIVHLAAEVGGLFKNMEQKVKMLENNVLMNFNILKSAHENNINNVMCCLSTCIFPDKVEYPIIESSLHNGPPHESNYAYAYAKRLLDIHCRVYREQYCRNYFCIIPTNIYGPHDNFNLNDAHVIPALIHQCYLAKEKNIPFVIKGSGKPLRQFIYSIDIAKCIYYLIFNYNNEKPVILSVSEQDEISIGDIAGLISKEMNYTNILFQTEFPDGQYKKTVENSYLLSILPSTFKFTPIESGISETIKWFCNNYNYCRK